MKRLRTLYLITKSDLQESVHENPRVWRAAFWMNVCALGLEIGVGNWALAGAAAAIVVFVAALRESAGPTIIKVEELPDGSFTISHGEGVSDPLPHDADIDVVQRAFDQAAERDQAIKEAR